MKNIIVFIVMVILLSIPNTWAGQSIGFLKSVAGNVEIRRGESIVKASQGLQILNTDVIATKSKGSAGIIFTDGTTIAIGPNTELSISNYKFEPDIKIYDFSIYLKKGSAIYNSGKIGKLSPDSVNLSTPRATIGIRGTRLIMNVE